MSMPDHLPHPWTDALGWIAAALTLLCFVCRDMRWLRVAALAANAGFIAYGASAQLLPVLVLHLSLVPVNLWRLVQALRPAAPGQPGAAGRPAAPAWRRATPRTLLAMLLAALLLVTSTASSSRDRGAAAERRPSDPMPAARPAHDATPPTLPHRTGRDAHILFVPRPDWSSLRRRIGPGLLVIDLAGLESMEAVRLLADSVRTRAGPQAELDCWLRANGRPARELLDAAAVLAARADAQPPPCDRIRVPDAP